MIVTTAGRTTEAMVILAKIVAEELELPYIHRNKQSIHTLHAQHQKDVLVIGKERFEWFRIGENVPIFFHPNTSAFRAKRFLAGEVEPFLSATALSQGMSFLDCTLGLASDSIIASLATGVEGKVVGMEGNRLLAYLVKKGLQLWESPNREMELAMKRIEVIHGSHQHLLAGCADNSFDVVYFDPMFDHQIEESDGISPLRAIAIYEEITNSTIQQALRVAKMRVVMKDHWKSERFERFGFEVIKRKTAKFHYGYLQKNDNLWTS